MALCTSRNIYACSLRLLAFKKIRPFLYSSMHQSTKDDTGILDEFTTQLMERKSNKWERRKVLAQKKVQYNKREIDIAKSDNIENSIENLNTDLINELFQRAIDYDDSNSIIDLTKQCIKYDRVPSLTILIHVLSVCSRKGDKNTIMEVSQLCEKLRPEILQENSNFEHYIAEAVWIKGNITKSLEIFEKVYKENVYLRRKLRFILRTLILESVASHSEATVINLLRFSDMLVKDHNDYFTLGCLWQACILSEWFTDQQIALDLLDKYIDLCKVIINKIPFVVTISLRHHRTEVVYRLTEALLKFDMKPEVGQVLLALLDYWIKQGDFRQCREIVLWSVQNDIEVPSVRYNEKFMKFFTSDIRSKFKSDLPKRTPSDYKF